MRSAPSPGPATWTADPLRRVARGRPYPTAGGWPEAVQSNCRPYCFLMQVYRVADHEAERVVAVLTAHGHQARIERYSADAVYVVAAAEDSEIADLVQATCRSARRVPSLTELTPHRPRQGSGS